MSGSNPNKPTDEENAEFEAALRATIVAAYPVLLERVRHAQFAGWHRRRGREEDLAHEATALVIRHCRRRGQLPDDLLAYLVTTARNLARKQYATRATDLNDSAKCIPISLAAPADISEDHDEHGTALTVQSRLELIQIAMGLLTKRQRTAVELYLTEPGATHRELGKRMGIGEDGFQKNLSRAMRRIRSFLKEHGLMGVLGQETAD